MENYHVRKWRVYPFIGTNASGSNPMLTALEEALKFIRLLNVKGVRRVFEREAMQTQSILFCRKNFQVSEFLIFVAKFGLL